MILFMAGDTAGRLPAIALFGRTLGPRFRWRKRQIRIP